jgi:16S rRNA processing protein RimM
LLEADVDPAEQPTDDSEFYDRQLIGLEARTVGGDLVGQVASVVHHGEQDTLVITRAKGADALVPFVAELVPTVDVAGGFLTIADVPGLLDQEAAE